jgi:hypothetical protein
VLGKSASELTAKLVDTVRGKFKASGTEGVLTRAENHPTQKHIDTVQDELAAQMQADERYPYCRDAQIFCIMRRAVVN